MKFDLLTIFPNSLDSYFNESILKRAQTKKLIQIKTHDIRQSAMDKHKTVDDTPYGGGPGMVLKIDVVHRALKKIYSPRKPRGEAGKRPAKNTLVILLSTRGKNYDQNDAKRLSKYKRLILISGHYEAIDARIDNYVDEKLSLGNFVLTGGELAAAAIVDSVSRLVPGVLGKAESLNEESHSQLKGGLTNIEYPQYTRPEVYQGHKVPAVLLSGNHKKIEKWRKKSSQQRKS